MAVELAIAISVVTELVVNAMMVHLRPIHHEVGHPSHLVVFPDHLNLYPIPLPCPSFGWPQPLPTPLPLGLLCWGIPTRFVSLGGVKTIHRMQVLSVHVPIPDHRPMASQPTIWSPQQSHGLGSCVAMPSLRLIWWDPILYVHLHQIPPSSSLVGVKSP